MSRTFHDLSPAEQNAYRVYQSKLADRTLPAAEHDRIRREIDNLLWKGANAQVQALSQALAKAVARIERLEFHAGLTADGVVGLTGNDPFDTIFDKPSFPIGADQVLAMVKDCGANPAKTIRPFGDGLQPNIMPHHLPGLAPCGQFMVDPHPSDADPAAPMPVDAATASIPEPTDPFDLPAHWAPTTPAQADASPAPVAPASMADDSPLDEKKPGRGRPKGAKNKPKDPPAAKAPPIPSGEGAESPATEIKEGVVTASNPSFTDRMVGVHDPEGEGGWPQSPDDFWQS